MSDVGFTDVTVLECLQRALDVRSVSVPVANLGYGAANSCCDLDAETKLGNRPITGCIETVSSRHRKHKKFKRDSDGVNGDNINDVSCADDDVNDEPVAGISGDMHTKAKNPDSDKQLHVTAAYNFKSSVPVSQMTGHTGYLTFATLCPK